MKRAAALVAALFGTALAVPTAQANAGASFAEFRTLGATAKTPTGQTLHLYIAAERHGTARPRVDILVSRQAKGTNEYHTWSFRMSRSSFEYHAPTGHLTTGTQLGRYGRIALTMTRKDSSSQTCNSVNGGTTRVTIVTMSVRASFTFRTLVNGKRSAWGTIRKGPGFNFGEGKRGDDYYPTYTYATNGMCKPRPSKFSFPPNCLGGWSWVPHPITDARSVLDIVEIDAPRDPGARHGLGLIKATRTRRLSDPPHAKRIDTAWERVPHPVYDQTNNSLQVATSSTVSEATGSAVWMATASGTDSQDGTCEAPDGNSVEQSSTTWPATWRNSSTDRFRIPQEITRPIALPNGTLGTFTKHDYPG